MRLCNYAMLCFLFMVAAQSYADSADELVDDLFGSDEPPETMRMEKSLEKTKEYKKEFDEQWHGAFNIFIKPIIDILRESDPLKLAKLHCAGAMENSDDRASYNACISGVYLAEGKIQDARDACSGARRNSNDNASYNACMSGVYLAEEKIQDARDACSGARQNNSDNASYNACMSGVYLAEEKIQDARDACSGARQNNSDNASYNACMSGVYLAEGKIQDARYACSGAMRNSNDRASYNACMSGVFLAHYFEQQQLELSQEKARLENSSVDNEEVREIEQKIQRRKEEVQEEIAGWDEELEQLATTITSNVKAKHPEFSDEEIQAEVKRLLEE